MSNGLPDELNKKVQSKRIRERNESAAAALGVDVDQHMADCAKPDQHSEGDPVRRYTQTKKVPVERVGRILGLVKVSLVDLEHLSDLAGDDLAASYFSACLRRNLLEIQDLIRAGEYRIELVEDSDDQA